MFRLRIFLIVLICLLVLTDAIAVNAYLSVKKQLSVSQALTQKNSLNSQVLNFTRLFIERVLQAKGEVSFENRLKLENMVRDLNDPAILQSWNNFVNSKSEQEAQENVKLLLDLLVRKITP
ncbi:MAG: hypothetical protein HY433_03120 [Candidatus Liptonbacteria bacterium]|nr:hypothetical protein [Candidatus Liptonbacteria bacterium]